MIDGKKCIGVLTSGGDAPGMNDAIRSVVRTALHEDMIPLGVVRGYNGLLEKNFKVMDSSSVSNILKKGGTILFTAPDFPSIAFVGTDFQGGIQYVKERIEEELLTSVVPPMATSMAQIPMDENRLLIQISV